MLAAVLSAPGAELVVEDIPIPEPRRGEVLVKVAACGVCHTDLHVMKGEVGFPTPCVLGHEISGTIASVGEGVANFAIGDAVACPFIMPCGECRHCVRGRDEMCEQFFGLNRLKGVLFDGETRLFRNDGSPLAMYSMAGLAEYAVVPAHAAFPLSAGSDLTQAAILGCSVFTAYGAVKNVAELTLGQTVAVFAVGGVGASIVQVARAFGAQTIIAVDLAEEKLELARRLGATHTFDGADPDLVAKIRAVTDGRGVDVAFEALGHATTVQSAIASVDDGGRVVLVGIGRGAETANLPITHTVRRRIQILGSFGARTRTDMPEVIKLFERGALDLATIISEVHPLSQVATAYARLSAGTVTGRAVIRMQ